MTFRVGLRCAACALVLALAVPGCKKAKVKSADDEPVNNPISNVRNQGGGPGVGAVLPSVGRAVTLKELKDFALAYQTLVSLDPNGRGPASLDAMPDFVRDSPKGAQAIKDGDIIVHWGATPVQAAAGSSNTVLAYVKDAPTKGGPVALLDGSARNVTKQEFDQLAKPLNAPSR
jgi:hypothetical protein